MNGRLSEVGCRGDGFSGQIDLIISRLDETTCHIDIRLNDITCRIDNSIALAIAGIPSWWHMPVLTAGMTTRRADLYAAATYLRLLRLSGQTIPPEATPSPALRSASD
jgi:hypothetical protein